MKGLIQRVSEASVEVGGRPIGAIGQGILLLLGVERGDGTRQARELCRRILSYRIFPDAQGRMNRSVMDEGAALLVVPQFTLAADTRSGTRPGFSRAAEPARAEALYRRFLEEARQALGHERVSEGQFGADMQVRLINDGPVTFLLEVAPGEVGK
ncbi:D-tyrosyl-tRNA(Tyr) deacylase [Marinobacter lutaoensis]|uniref:D-aminoacyl-tRNA deacylase n=1 Tax=Marinobacter lutaoensis TaxID=135739 RepID=A0A1V2DWV7_9GAMM|nr:D-aminoacyl-tRNA deacylase [Marinobacter lutaoensis]ONF44751.1 D-tyrosyl-tRNA(Tyr) deacylase [Marinobacter lutaoensis]